MLWKSIRTAFIISTLLLGALNPLSAYYPEDYDAPLKTIAFGSCNQHDLPQQYWQTILSNNLDLWIWGGDNIYGDSTDKIDFRRKYRTQFSNSDYRKLRESVPVIGTWDDHDYGENNSDKRYIAKEMTQPLALDFLEEPKDSPRRKQKGIYTSYTFGPKGKQIKILLIDNRYHADKPGPDADLLGEAQWRWLRNELKSSQAHINFIVSGTQVLPEEQRFEKWANYPKTRNQLFNFIRKQKIPGVIFLSGDRHIHEISKKSDSETLYPLVDVTSSGLTHYYKEFKGEPNKYRVGEVYAGKGFGLIKIDWDKKDPAVTLQIRDMENKVQEEISLSLGELTPGN